MPDKRQATPAGRLYIVAMPIGNMEDITLRALRILAEVDVIAAEDTRNVGKILAFHNVKNKLLSCHEHNEAARVTSLIKKLIGGSSVALVSDAGTPSVSDPGFRIVSAAVENNIQLIPIPGPSAAVTALSVSGLPTDSFVFVGFLPKKKNKRMEQLKGLSHEKRTVLFYESPKRILLLLQEIMHTFGDRYGVLAREMTKPYEEFQRGLLSEIFERMGRRDSIKGECTLLVSGQGDIEKASLPTIRKEIEVRLKMPGCRPSSLAKELAAAYGWPKNKIYDEILTIKKGTENPTSNVQHRTSNGKT